MKNKLQMLRVKEFKDYLTINIFFDEVKLSSILINKLFFTIFTSLSNSFFFILISLGLYSPLFEYKSFNVHVCLLFAKNMY